MSVSRLFSVRSRHFSPFKATRTKTSSARRFPFASLLAVSVCTIDARPSSPLIFCYTFSAAQPVADELLLRAKDGGLPDMTPEAILPITKLSMDQAAHQVR